MQYQSDFISGIMIKENGIDLRYPLYNAILVATKILLLLRIFS